MSLKNHSAADRCALQLKVLADETRLEVVRQLMKGPQHVGDLNRSLGLEQSLLSHHLRVLRDAGLSDTRQSLAAIAIAHGYADQAHLSRELVSLTGATPGKVRRRSKRSPPHLLAQV